jgi:hypothetical protein
MTWTRMAMAALFAAAVPALAQNVPVRIIKPLPEQAVRGSVPVVINASAVPSSGYMQVEINDEFMAAVAPTPGVDRVEYVWDTKQDFPETGAPPRDGQYTVRAKTYTNRFEFVRSNELNVYLRNHISVAPDKTFRLRYSFRPDESFRYVENVSANLAGQEVYSAYVPVTLTVNDVYGGVAEARERISSNAAERVSGTRQPLALAGRSFIVELRPNGAIIPGRRMERAGASPAAAMLVFPNTPLKVGDTWDSDITLTPYYNGVQSATINGRNTLDGFEYMNGRPVARIESAYDGTATVTLATGQTTVTFRGKRVTFFDHVRGRLLRAEDTLTANFGAAGGGGGYPGADSAPAVDMTIVTVAQ